MLMRTDPFLELDRLTQQFLGANGTASRQVMMPMDAYRSGNEYVVAFDLPGSRRIRSKSTWNATC